MKHILRRLLVSFAAAAILGCTFLATPAHAADGDEFTKFDVQATLADDGSMQIVQTLDLTFASDGHGPYVYFTTRQGYDEDNDRMFTFSDISVTSPSGAPTDTDVSRSSDAITLRVGDPDETVSGTQTYVLSYTVKGIMNPHVESSGMDELYWNVIPSDWSLPISNVSITVHGIAGVQDTTCFAGTGQDPCTSHVSSGNTATFTQDSLDPYEPLTIDAGWPAGTYPNAKIDVVPAEAGAFTPAGSGAIPAVGAGVLTIIAGVGVGALSRKGRDKQFANVTPGELPVDGDKVEVTRGEVKDAAVEFAPPQGVPPRMVGAIVRESVANVDVTATIVSMAVHGYIHLEGGESDSFTLQRTTKDPASLDSVEQEIYNGLFASGPVITSAAMSEEAFYDTFQEAQSAIQQEFNSQNWYKSNPKLTVSRYRMLGITIAFIGVLIALFIGTSLADYGRPGWSWIGFPFVVFGIGLFVIANKMPVRTPVGSALATKSFGFKKYLETAEADQIKWEEGQDIFSEYLPYAVSFGCADRWAKVFQDLAARGAPVPQPTWFSGYGYGYYSWAAINTSVNSIGNSFQTAIAQHAASQAHSITGGSSGGSGFGGGGFGGGGVGGGGGGSW